MIATLLPQRISKMTAWLAAAALVFPAPIPAACGCGRVNVSPGEAEQPHAGSSIAVGKACCRRHAAEHGKSGCRPLRSSRRPCPCSTVATAWTFGRCNCGPSCACGQTRAPDPPAGPVNRRIVTAEQVAAVPAGVSSPLLPGQVDAGAAGVDRRRDQIDARTTALERCILLSCFTL